jgi:long-subunit acyl-CoA synthetase (AMP-forming)
MLTEIKYQRVRRVILIDREPSMARGELTPTSKIVRHRVLETYHHELKELFEPNPPNWVIEVVEHELQAS